MVGVSSLTLKITFNSSFRIGSGRSGNMLDDVLDRDRLLPGSSLKGVMREAARALFPMLDEATDHRLVSEVFGTTRNPSPWHWDDAEFTANPKIRPQSRIALDARRRTQPGALFVVETAHTPHATATIWQQDQIVAGQLQAHLALLNLAARLVEGLGADRRRGLGWVTISTDRHECDKDIAILFPQTGGPAS